MPSGFLYNIRAVVDKASFAEGMRELEKFEQSSARLMKGIAGMGAAALASATIAGQVAQQELRTAKAIGTSTEAMSGWKIACNVAGASASGLIGTLSALENKMQHLKTGQVDMGLAKSLGMMGIGYNDFAEMDAEGRMRAVFSQADNMEDQKLAATLVGDILGQAGRDYYDSLKLSGKSLETQLTEAKKLNFVSETNRKEAAVFATEMRSVKEAGKSIAMLVGSEIGAALTPTVRRVKNYLIQNRDQIRKGIAGVAQVTGKVFEGIAGAIGKVAPFIEKLIDGFGGLDKLIVKVGIGFASMKLMQVAGGIRAIVGSLNLLKAGMGGLATMGIFLVLEDLMYYFSGGDSVMGDVIKGFDSLKEKLKLDFNIDLDKVINGLKNLGNEIAKFAGGAVKNGLTLLKDFGHIIKDLVAGDWEQLGKDIKRFLKDWKDGFMELFNLKKVAEEGQKAFRESRANGEGVIQSGVNAYDAGARQLPLVHYVYEGGYKLGTWAEDKVKGIFGGNKAKDATIQPDNDKGKIKDGIISPDGRVIGISSNDWVFAAKNLTDMAAAFLPPSVTNNSNSVNAPASYVINQTFNVQGGGNIAQTIKAQAYRGTADALQQNLVRAGSYVQQTSGLR